jgi:hypothetical protein
MMKKAAAFAMMTTILLAPAMLGDEAKTTFEAKCKMCHGADLSKKPIDLTKPDADLVKHLTTDAKHKSKVTDEAAAKALVAYLKTLKK